MSTTLCERNRSDYMHATGAMIQVPIAGAVKCSLESRQCDERGRNRRGSARLITEL
jgi:hypothetical protein